MILVIRNYTCVSLTQTICYTYVVYFVSRTAKGITCFETICVFFSLVYVLILNAFEFLKFQNVNKPRGLFVSLPFSLNGLKGYDQVLIFMEQQNGNTLAQIKIKNGNVLTQIE